MHKSGPIPAGSPDVSAKRCVAGSVVMLNFQKKAFYSECHYAMK